MSSVPILTSFPYVDTIVLGNIILPGKWTLTSATKVFGWQVQMGNYMSGARVLPTGDKLTVAKFKGVFWDPIDFKKYTVIRSNIMKKPVFAIGGLAAALDVLHPELEAMGCDSVVISEYSAVIQEEPGYWTTTLDLLEYRPPVVAPAVPTQKLPIVVPAKSAIDVAKDKFREENAAKVAKLL
jgi:hypothetical protein